MGWVARCLIMALENLMVPEAYSMRNLYPASNTYIYTYMYMHSVKMRVVQHLPEIIITECLGSGVSVNELLELIIFQREMRLLSG